MTERELLAIVATIIYAGDGIEAAIIAAGTTAGEEKPIWGPPATDGATPRITIQEAITNAVELLNTCEHLAGAGEDE